MRVTLTYLEFYSGIGGWGYAVEHACRSIVKEVVASSPPATHPSVLSKAGNAEGDNLDLVDNFHLQSRLLAAYDHSDLANSVFYHNHSTKSNDGSFVDASSSSSLSSSLSSPDRENSKASRKKKKAKRIDSNDGQCNNRPRQTPIERLTVEELQSHSADIWCMSPPCQPHTRQHSNQHKESEDTRSKSFLHLCKLLCDMEENRLPKLILLENVIGFEKEQTSCNDDGSRSRSNSEDCQRDASLDQNGSDQRKSPLIEVQSLSSGDQECANGAIGSFQSFRRALSRRNYHVGHFHLDPTHVGIPNNRPRHYTVALRQWQQNRPDVGGKEVVDAATCGETSAQPFTNTGLQHKPPDGETTRQPPLFQDNNGKRRYDHLFNQELQLDNPPTIHDENALHEKNRLPPLSSLSSFLDNDLPPHIEAAPALSEKHKSLQIPEKVRASSSAWCFDIATPNNNCITSCFTHSYGKFVRGTGSILYTGPPLLLEGKYNISDSADSSANHRFQLKSPEERVFDATWSNDLDWDNHLRYFSGTEIARLMGFPVSETPGTAPCKDVVNAESAAKTGAGDTSTVGSESSFRKFSFQPECTMKQQWKLLGNSLNVRVAAIVAEIGIQSILDDLHTDTILKETN